MRAEGMNIQLPNLDSNPFSTSPIEGNQNSLYVGRLDTRARISQHINFRSNRKLLLVGEYGSGRTSLLRCAALEAPISVHIDHISSTNPGLSLLQKMYSELVGFQLPDNQVELVSKLVESSRSFINKLPLIVIDMPTVEDGILSVALRDVMPSLERLNAVIVVVIEPKQKTSIPDSVMHSFADVETLSPLSADEIKELVERRIDTVSQVEFKLSTTLAREIFQRTAGSPYEVVKLMRDIVDSQIMSSDERIVAYQPKYKAPELPIDVEEIERLSVWSNSGGSRGLGRRSGSPDRVGGMFIDFYGEDEAVSDLNGFEIMEVLRDRLKDTSGYIVQVEEEKGGPPIGKPLQLNVSGDNEQLLVAAIGKIRSHLESMGSFIDIEDTTVTRGIEWELQINRTKAAQYGAGLSDVGASVQMVTNGIKVGEYRPLNLDREVDIRVRFPKSERNIDQLGNLNVQTMKGLVPVSSFVETNIKPATKSISRKDGKRVHSISANTVEGAIPSVQIKKVKDWLATQDLGRGVSVGDDGFDKYNKEAADFLVLGFIAMLFVMLIVLVAQFNSFYQANIVLSAILLSYGGVFVSLLILDRSFSTLQTGISCVALAGIVVNNNIVLIDTFNLLKRNNPGSTTKSLALRSAILRLRPVFLTSFTTIAGLLPIALGYSIDLIDRTIKSGSYITSFWEQMAGSLVVGLTVATILTLVVTPCALAFSDTIRSVPSRIFRFLSRPFLALNSLRKAN